MSIRIGNNISSLIAQRRLGQAESTLARIYERLSTGQRINRGSDDAAGLALSAGLDLNVRVYTQAIRNANDAISLLNVAEAALGSLKDITGRQQELAAQACNGTFSITQRRALDCEAYELTKEFNRIVEETKFNDRSLFESQETNATVAIQLGTGNESILSLDISRSLSRATGDGTFQPLSGPGTPYSGDWGQLVDLNGDGNLDVLSGHASVGGYQPGRGDGTFGPAVNLGSFGTGNAAADFNADGRTDIMFGSFSGTGYQVFTNDGQGGFSGGAVVTAQSGCMAIKAGDFNSDGYSDAVMVFGSPTSQGMAVLLNNRDGTFTTTQSFSQSATYASSAAIGDVNSDGSLDIISSGHLFLNNGAGSFAYSGTLYISERPNIGADQLVDLDHDGFLDYVSDNGNSGGTTGRVSINFGRGDGTFQSAVSIFLASPGSRPRTIAVTDFNGDGNVDLAIEDTWKYVVYTLTGNGDGTFKGPVQTATDGWFTLASGDINKDGAVDLLMDEGTLFGNVRSTASAARLDLTTVASARISLSSLDEQSRRVHEALSDIGAYQSRLDLAVACLQEKRAVYSAASARITDADVAAESADLVRTRILRQAAAAVLAQANAGPGIALTLLAG